MTADVNELFDAEQRGRLDAVRDQQRKLNDRIASGELRAIGGGRYEVTAGYDRGEIWTQRGGLLVPQHGLDTSAGKTALYTRVPAWHSAGTVIPGGLTSIDEVLDAGGIGFQVALRATKFLGRDLDLTEVPGSFVTVRTDTWAPLGVVGSRYTVFQNRAAMEFLLDLTGRLELTWETAGALRGGSKVFVTVEVPDGITIDPSGINDKIRLFLAVINSHDGTMPVTAIVTPWRVLCGNTERFARRDARYKWATRHTKNATERYEEARKALGMTLEYAKAWQADEEKLLANELLLDDFRGLLGQVLPRKDDESKKAKTQLDNRDARIMALWDGYKDELGPNAYAAERTFTDFWDNHVSRRIAGGTSQVARATAIMEDDGTDRKTRVHDLLMRRIG